MENRKIYFFLLLIIIFHLFHQYIFNTDAEDAYISYRYVRNFIEGNGLVFNNGERVEGYSNFLWMLIIASISKVTHLEIPTTARILGAFFSSLTIVMTYYLGNRLCKGYIYGLCSALIVAASGSFAAYGSSGLEPPLFSLLILLIIYFVLNELWLLTGLFVGLSAMTRPDGILLIISLWLFIFISNYSLKEKIKISTLQLVGLGIIIIPWLIWRLEYYGYFIPNAIASKQGQAFSYLFSTGMSYTIKFFALAIWPLTILAVFLIYNAFKNSGQKRLEFEPIFFLLLFMVSIHTLYVIFIGGDWMPAWRLYSPFIPLIALLLTLSWKIMFHNAITKITYGVFILSAILLFSVSFTLNNMIRRVHLWNNQLEGVVSIGKWFNQSLPKDTVVAAFAIGGLSFYSQLPTIDMVGLTDVHIARHGKKRTKGWAGHISFDDDYVLMKKPTIIYEQPGFNLENKFEFNQFFAKDYTPVSCKFKTANPLGSWANILILKDKKEQIIKLLSANNSVDCMFF